MHHVKIHINYTADMGQFIPEEEKACIMLSDDISAVIPHESAY